jgi:predicted ATPase/class 3 adenylate cyclase
MRLASGGCSSGHRRLQSAAIVLRAACNLRRYRGRVQVRLLGPVEVVGSSGPIPLGGPKERAVLTALALRAGETVSEDALAEALWGEALPPTAIKTLRVYVSRLRKVLAAAGRTESGEFGIDTTPAGYVLRLGPQGRDVDEVSAIIQDARAAMAAGDAAGAVLAFGRALQCWRGRPLGEFADEAFARTEAARLEELRQLVMEERIDAELACGHHTALLGELESLTSRYPLRERLWAQRMTALYRAGRQAEALEVYQHLRRRLSDELGIDPSPSLVELHSDMLQQRSSLDWAVTLPSGVVTFLLTDIEGSTALWETQRAAMPSALARHDEILAKSVKEHHGTLLKAKGEGDSAFAVFATASDAASAALAAQRMFAAEAWPDNVDIRVRMAIHTGEAELRNGDYFGSTVNRAARLRELAHGGQTVLSQAAADVLGDVPPDDGVLIDLGEHRLRDFSRLERIFQLVDPALATDFPPLRSYGALTTNLPAQTTTFVGRDRQLADIATALEAARVVTLTGVGGVGKTRLALQVAAATLPDYRDGAWLVELAPIVEAATIVEVVATAVGANQRQGQTLAASLIDFLRTKRLLLLLDNCEHLLDGVARFVDEVVRTCAHLRILATSREGLAVAGERIIAVPSLQLPTALDADAESVENTEAVRLFVARAVEARAGFALTDKNRAAVAQICRRLDGIPLAIELAAARVRSLAPADLAARLDERFRLLAGGPRTAVERHQTLRRAIDWSYDLLAATEQHALNRLAVFSGTFDVEAAEAVLPGDEIEAIHVVDLLGRLVDKSLVVMEEQDGNTRYRLLETIRSYAQDRLEAAGELEAFHRRHAEYYADFATRAGDGLRGPGELEWTPRVDAELDNLRAALVWAAANDDADIALRIVVPLANTGMRSGYASAPWAETAVALPAASANPLYPEAVAWAATVASTTGDLHRSMQLARDALDQAEAHSLAGRPRIRVLVHSSIVAMWSGQLELAERLTDEWIRIARSMDDDYYLAGGLNTAGAARLFSGDVETARVHFGESVTRARRAGNPSMLGFVTNMAAECVIDTEPERARDLLEEGLAAATSVDNRYAMGMNIGFSVFLHLRLDDWREAARCVLFAGEYWHNVGESLLLRGLCVAGAVAVLTEAGAHEAAARLCGAVRTELVADRVKNHFDAAVTTLRDRLGEDGVAAYAAIGAAMDDDDIIAVLRTEISSRLAGGT